MKISKPYFKEHEDALGVEWLDAKIKHLEQIQKLDPSIRGYLKTPKEFVHKMVDTYKLKFRSRGITYKQISLAQKVPRYLPPHEHVPHGDRD